MTIETTGGSGSYRRDALLAAVSRMAPLVVQLLATPLVLGELGRDAYAAWALTMTTINLLLTADLGVVGIMQRYHGVARGRGDSELPGRITASVLLVLGVILAIVTLAGPWIADLVLALVPFPEAVSGDARMLFQNAGTLASLQLIALALSSYLAAHSRFVAAAGLSLGARLVLVIAILVALAGHHGLHGLLIAAYADACAAILLGLWLCRTHLTTEVRQFTTRVESRELWSYAWRNQASALGFVAQRELDVIMAGILLSTASLASMSAAAPLTAAVCLAPSVLLAPLFTRLSVQAGADPALLGDEATRAERAWLALVLPFSALVLAVLPLAAATWLGPQLVQVAELSALLSAGFLLSLVNGVRAILVRAAGHPGIESRAYLAHAVVKIVAGTAIALTFGVVGLATAGILAAATSLVVLRRGAGRLVPSTVSTMPPMTAWVMAGGLLVGCGTAAWLVSAAGTGRPTTLALLAAVAVVGVAVIIVVGRRSSTDPVRPT